MKDSRKTKDRLIEELEALRAQLKELKRTQLEPKEIEEAVTSANRRLNHLLATSPAVLYSCQAHGDYAATYVSDNVEHILGYRSTQFTQNPRFWLEHIHAGDRDRILRELELALEQDSHTHEYRFRCPDGSYRWLYDELRLIRDLHGNPVEMVGSMIDITGLKETEEELRRAHQEWEGIFQAIGHSTVILDPNYNVMAVNRATVRATGRSEQELQGKKCYEIFHEAGRPPEGCPLEAMHESGHLETIEMEIQAFGGVFLVSCTPVLDDRGRLQKIIHIATDISDRKLAEEALRRERDFNKRLIQASPAFVVSISPDGKTLMMNEAMLQALGYTEEEVAGKDYLSTFVPEADRAGLADVFNRLISRKEPTVNENHVITKDGRELLIEWHGRQVFDANSNVEYFFGVGIDITERKRAEEAVRMAEVGKLASGLVHEVRNPLTAMRMQIAVIRHKLGHADQQNINLAVAQLEGLEHEVSRVQELANDFLAYGRPTSDHPQIIALPRVVSDVAEFIKPEFEQIGVRIDVAVGENIGRLAVRMDMSKLRQVLLNLAANARQAMAHGGQLSFGCDRPSKREARIQVRDTGCGIPPDQLPRVFDVFYSTKDEGTGLGLAIVKRTIEVAGGRVQVESEVDHGTCFEIYLPLAPEASPAQAGAETEN